MSAPISTRSSGFLRATSRSTRRQQRLRNSSLLAAAIIPIASAAERHETNRSQLARLAFAVRSLLDHGQTLMLALAADRAHEHSPRLEPLEEGLGNAIGPASDQDRIAGRCGAPAKGASASPDGDMAVAAPG